MMKNLVFAVMGEYPIKRIKEKAGELYSIMACCLIFFIIRLMFHKDILYAGTQLSDMFIMVAGK